jgi:DNA repair exonuclease SbcCD nuclease subunit
MMKILVTSDWHLDWSSTGMPRFDDLTRVIEDMVDEHANEIGLFLFLGDLTDPYSSRAWRAVDFAATIARGISDRKIPSVWISGNHDTLDDGFGTTTIDCLQHVATDAPVEVVTGFRVIQLAGIELMLLPHPGMVKGYSSAEQKRRPAIIAGHLTLQGYDRGSESEDMPRGKEVLFPYAEIREHYPNAVLLNGHHHKRGTFGDKQQPVHVPGSLARLTFNEEHNAPGYLLLEI